jgi:hypothetical protein
MSDIDNDARTTMKNMIQYASPISLLPRGIASIAVFAFKAAVVADHARPKNRPFLFHSVRKRFAESLEIPHGIQVWLAAFGQEHLSGRFSTHYAKLHGRPFRGFELYIFTYVAGFLALQVTASRWASIAKQPKFTPILTQDPAWDRASVPLWPSDGTPVNWPPRDYLRDDSLKFFAERWARLRRG